MCLYVVLPMLLLHAVSSESLFSCCFKAVSRLLSCECVFNICLKAVCMLLFLCCVCHVFSSKCLSVCISELFLLRFDVFAVSVFFYVLFKHVCLMFS